MVSTKSRRGCLLKWGWLKVLTVVISEQARELAYICPLVESLLTFYVYRITCKIVVN